MESNDGEKANDLPVWEVEEHTQQKLGALPNKYYEGCVRRAHEFHNFYHIAQISP